MFTIAQIKLLANFFSNMAVVWFGAAFIASGSIVTKVNAFAEGSIALCISFVLLREVNGR
jgi:hypothetical protein